MEFLEPRLLLDGDWAEPNDSFATARDLGPVAGESTYLNLSIHASGDEDWFRFQTTGDGGIGHAVQIDFSHSLGDLDMRLYDAVGGELDSSVSTTDDEAISLSGRPAGTYCVKVYGWSGATNSYTLTIDAPGVVGDSAEPNDSHAAARNLGQVQGQAVWADLSIHAAGNDDWYRFEIIDEAVDGHYVRIEFQHAQGDVDMGLFTPANEYLRGSWSATDNEEISLAGLGAGWHYLRVYGWNDATNPDYTLIVNAPEYPAGDWAEPNDTRLGAHDLLAVQGQNVWTDLSIHESGDDDWFGFELTDDAVDGHWVRIDLLHRLGDLDLELFDASGGWLDGAYSTGDCEQISLAGRGAGRYYVQVFGWAGATNPDYQLTIDAPEPAAGDWAEPNDSMAGAYNLRDVAGQNVWAGLSIHESGNEDWFRLELAADAVAGHFARIDFRHACGDVDMKLYDAGGALLGKSIGVTDAEEISLAGLAAGTYYLQTYGYAGAVNPDYTLTIAAPQPPTGDWAEPNDERAQAYDLRQAVGENVWTGLSIHEPGNDDWFGFELSGDGGSGHYVRIDFLHQVGDLDMALYDADGSFLARSDGVMDQEQIPLTSYAAGSYYLRVYGYAGAVNPDYTLTVNGPSAPTGDRFEPNESFAAAYNFRDVTGQRCWDALSIHSPADLDFFKFTTAAQGTSSHYVQIEFDHGRGDLDMRLYDAAMTELGRSISTTDDERIALEGLPGGTYYVKVYGWSGATNDYALAISAPDTGAIAPDGWEGSEPIVLEQSQTIAGLTIHDPAVWAAAGTRQDAFTFTTAGEGGAWHYVEIQFAHAEGDLQMSLYDAGPTLVGSSNTDTDNERISLAGLPVGTYCLYVDGTGEATNRYQLAINAPFDAGAVADWTILVYVDGDNNLEAAALDDVNEMEAVSLPAGIQLAVLIDRIAGYSTADGNWMDTRRGVIVHDSDPSRISSPLTSLGERNVARADTVTEFINWGVSALPADHYALILWDHGGATYGSEWDDTSRDSLTIAELKAALAGAAQIDVLGFDACLMGTVEVMDAAGDYVDYLVASEETEGFDGWDYTDLLNDLIGWFPWTPEQFASGLVASSSDDASIETLSATRASSNALIGAMADFVAAVQGSATQADWDAIIAARNAAPAFEYQEFRDLGSFLDGVAAGASNATIRASAAAARAVLDQTVVNNYSTGRAGGTGLSIYLPGVGESVYSGYSQLDFPIHTGWDDFLTTLTAGGSAGSGGARSYVRDWAEPNDVRAAAKDLQAVAGHGQRYAGLAIHSGADVDWFRFTTLGAGGAGDQVRITFTNSEANLDLYLYDSAGSLLGSSAADADAETISLNTRPAGQYFIKIVGRSGATSPNYSLLIDAPGLQGDWAEDNNTRDKAGPIKTNRVYGGLNLLAGDVDWYTFEIQKLPACNTLNVTGNFSAAEGSLELRLYDAQGSHLATSSPAAGGALLSYANFSSGRFFLRVGGTVSAALLPYSLHVAHDAAASLPDAMEPFFHEQFYLSRYADVRSAVGEGTFQSGYEHFVRFGLNEGRNPSPHFNEGYYLNRNTDVRNAVNSGSLRSGFEHFVRYGQFEGRAPSPFFDPTYYRNNNADVVAGVAAGAVNSIFEHFLRYGQTEGRDGSPFFNEMFYRQRYGDIQPAIDGGAIASGLEHYLMDGASEGRSPFAIWDEKAYLRRNPDVAAMVAAGAYQSGFLHYMFRGAAEGRSPSAFFDAWFYLKRNPQAQAAIAAGACRSAFEHYVRWGAADGRNPCLLFDEAYYRARYGDVLAAIGAGTLTCGYEHYLRFGAAEGRQTCSFFNEQYYLALHGDVRGAVQAGTLQSGLEHFAPFGQFEGRCASFDEQRYLSLYADVRAAVDAGTIASGLQHFVRFGAAEGRNPSPFYVESYYLGANSDVRSAIDTGVLRCGLEHYQLFGRFEGRPPSPWA